MKGSHRVTQVRPFQGRIVCCCVDRGWRSVAQAPLLTPGYFIHPLRGFNCLLPSAYCPSTLRNLHRIQPAQEDALAALDAAWVLLRVEDVERGGNHRGEVGRLLR